MEVFNGGGGGESGINASPMEQVKVLGSLWDRQDFEAVRLVSELPTACLQARVRAIALVREQNDGLGSRKRRRHSDDESQSLKRLQELAQLVPDQWVPQIPSSSVEATTVGQDERRPHVEIGLNASGEKQKEGQALNLADEHMEEDRGHPHVSPSSSMPMPPPSQPRVRAAVLQQLQSRLRANPSSLSGADLQLLLDAKHLDVVDLVADDEAMAALVTDVLCTDTVSHAAVVAFCERYLLPWLLRSDDGYAPTGRVILAAVSRLTCVQPRAAIDSLMVPLMVQLPTLKHVELISRVLRNGPVDFAHSCFSSFIQHPSFAPAAAAAAAAASQSSQRPPSTDGAATESIALSSMAVSLLLDVVLNASDRFPPAQVPALARLLSLFEPPSPEVCNLVFRLTTQYPGAAITCLSSLESVLTRAKHKDAHIFMLKKKIQQLKKKL